MQKHHINILFIKPLGLDEEREKTPKHKKHKTARVRWDITKHQKPLSLDEEREKARLWGMSVSTYVTPEQTGFDNAIR